MIIEVSLTEIAKITRQAAQKSAGLSTEAKNQAIEAVAQALETAAPKILAANKLDCQIAQTNNIAKPLYNRLKMDEAKLNGAIAGLRNVSILPDPVGAGHLPPRRASAKRCGCQQSDPKRRCAGRR